MQPSTPTCATTSFRPSFNVRDDSLWAVLSAATDAEIEDLLEVTEFLQLPKGLCARLTQQRAANRLRKAGHRPAADTGLTGTYLDVVQDDSLCARFKEAVGSFAHFLCVQHEVCTSLDDAVLELVNEPSPLWDGLLGTPPDLCRTVFDAKALPLYVLGVEFARVHREPVAEPPAPLAPLRAIDGHPQYNLAISLPMVLAAQRDDPVTAERLLGLGFPITAHALWSAAQADSAAFLSWAQLNGHGPDDRAQFIAASSACHKALLWMRDAGVKLNEWATAGAADGSLTTLKMLRSPSWQCPWDDRVAAFAAVRPSCELLQWARAQDPPCPWNQEACRSAAAHGKLGILQWLRSQAPPCPWGFSVCKSAAALGRLEVLQWLRSQDPPCPWSPATCIAAAENGHFEVLKWLRAQVPPCPWNAYVIVEAATEEITAWARANSCPEPGEDSDDEGEDDNEGAEEEDE